MKERIYQLGFQEFPANPRVEVTPPNFQGLEFQKPEPLPRFVREVHDSVPLTSPAQVAQYLMDRIFTPFESFDQEELWGLLLNTQLRVTHEVMIYRGTVNSAMIREAEVLKEAVRVNAPSLVLAHCHPSGNATPSPEDISTTQRINQAAKILGIDFLDHIVIGNKSYVSLKERGLGFGSK
ncbi:MAG: hypothetical protein EXR62_07745 [Chloroflexi bacterium]|nr:hypothetical protein [Chloroflexota bacterium]